MLIPIGTDRPQRRFPWMNIALIAINVTIFALSRPSLRTMGPAAFLDRAWLPYMLSPADPRLYQFITYQFLHAGLMHIGFNMLFLYVFGNGLNEKLGHVGYLLFYLAGGVLAGCGQVLSSDAQTLGASGSVSAVTGLFLVLLPRIHIKLLIWFFFVDIWEIPSMYFILFKVGQDVFEHMIGSSGVAYMAHLSGTAAGFVVGLLLLVTRLVQRDHYDLLAMVNRQRRRQEYRSIVAQGYDPFNPTRGVRGSVKPGGLPNTDPRIESLRAEVARLLRLHEVANASQRYLELRAIDATQVLPPQEQLDVASQLMSNHQYPEAAAAFEDYLQAYPTGRAGQQDQITLMLGVIYGRYLPTPANRDRARALLQGLLPSLHSQQEKDMALAELKALDTPDAPPPPTA